ncbi:MAG: helix-turn-helix domain-containing protein [Bacteroidetes bacterium]|nr:helix-turn-helix domain-containing protein [Bacteroidota bacterium]
MKHISILALHYATINSIDSCQQMLSRVNDFLRYQQKEPYFTIEIVGLQKTIGFNNGLYNLNANTTISEVEHTDIVILPLLCGDFPKAIQANEGYREWVLSQYRNGAEIAALCVGSFFLASTGLLNRKKCAIHWAAKEEFRTMFPEVATVDGNIITDESGIYTCAGGYSYLNLLLYIIEKHLGREMSILASKMFEIDIERKSQNPFAIFLGQRRHGDNEVLAAQQLIENDPTGTFSIDEICTRIGVGRRTFERRFRAATGNSIAEYIQRVKVEYVKQQLESNRKTINEVIYEVGYNDIDAFRKLFRRYTDLSPVDYRKKYKTSGNTLSL